MTFWFYLVLVVRKLIGALRSGATSGDSAVASVSALEICFAANLLRTPIEPHWEPEIHRVNQDC